MCQNIENSERQFFIDYVILKGILRYDETDVRNDCPEYQPSLITMRARYSQLEIINKNISIV